MPDLIHQFIVHSAQVTPHAPALLFKEPSYSYAQLQYEVDAAANALVGLGFGPGERVALYLPTQAETVLSLFGAAALGLPHAALGQAILLVITPGPDAVVDAALEESVPAHCRRELPNFMVPTAIIADNLSPLRQGRAGSRHAAVRTR
jgi:acyl-coenzyme A synthetase/AMP-(fatty) acid ligase